MSNPVYWTRAEGGLADVLGVDDLTALKDTAKGIAEAIKFVYEALEVAAQAANILNQLGDLGLATLLRPIIEDLRERIQDFRKTGIYMLPLGFRLGKQGVVSAGDDFPFLTGGRDALKNAIRAAVLNDRDPGRPPFGNDAYVGGIGVFAFGPDAAIIRVAKDLLEKAFIGDDAVAQAAAGLVKYTRTLGDTRFFTEGFKDAYQQYRDANTITPQTYTPWISRTLQDLVPGVGAFLLRVEAALNGILAVSLKIRLAAEILAVIQAALQEIALLLRIIEDIVKFLDLILTRFPVLIMRFEPQIGGVRGLARDLDDWFNPSLHPELADFSPNAYAAGMLFLAGFPSFEDADDTSGTIEKLLKFSP